MIWNQLLAILLNLLLYMNSPFQNISIFGFRHSLRNAILTNNIYNNNIF